eukprot:s200_g49.t1
MVYWIPLVGAATVEPVNQTAPDTYVGFGSDAFDLQFPGPSIEKLSFTDAFLRAVRLWASTADVLPQQGPLHDVRDDEQPEDDAEFGLDFDNLEILQDFPGDQNWWIFRPDPTNTGRADSLNMDVTAETTMQEIEQRIIALWPDLQPGRPDWELLLAHNEGMDVLTVPTSEPSFVLRAQNDLDQMLAQQSVILLSMRTWNPPTGHAYSSALRAFVVDTQEVVHEFFNGIDFQGRCDGLPCPIEITGQVLNPWHHEYPIRLLDGDYVLVQAVTRQDQVTQITADQTRRGIPELNELPQAFQHRALDALQLPGREHDDLLLLASHFQQSLTSWARNIHEFTKMECLYKRQLADMLDSEEQNWHFVSITEVGSASLEHMYQYLGIRRADHVSFFEQDALCLIEIHLASEAEGTLRFQDTEFSSRFLPMRMFPEELYALLGLLELCRDSDCSVKVDGVYVIAGDDIHVEEGSFLQIYIDDVQEPDTTMMEICTETAEPQERYTADQTFHISHFCE